MVRVRELGLESWFQRWWRLSPGPRNAITDVIGVRVGHFTLIQGEGPLRRGQGPFRTGVTVIVPHGGDLYREKVPAAVHVINGFGKSVGLEQIRELGVLETPIALTSTLNVPRVADALITLALEEHPHIGVGDDARGRPGYATVNPVVGETNDGYLNDVHGRPIGLEHVRQALYQATGNEVEEGSVGAGTGTSCYGWKGGIGTASRVLPEQVGGGTVGVLVQTNFGRPEELVFLGVPVGAFLRPPNVTSEIGAGSLGGSVMVIIATDLPLTPRQLARLARRAAFGLARTGSVCHADSGDFVIAFSTAYTIPERPAEPVGTYPVVVKEARVLNAAFLAVVEAVEEAVLNSLTTATTVVGRDGHVRYALPVEEVVELIQHYSERCRENHG